MTDDIYDYAITTPSEILEYEFYQAGEEFSKYIIELQDDLYKQLNLQCEPDTIKKFEELIKNIGFQPFPWDQKKNKGAKT